MIVVSDTSAIRALVQVQTLELLPRMFDQVFVPPAVLDELSVVVPDLVLFDLNAYPFLLVLGSPQLGLRFIAPNPSPFNTALIGGVVHIAD